MEILDLVKERVRGIVTRAFDEFGYFAVEKEKREFFDIAITAVLTVTDRIGAGQFASLDGIRTPVLEAIYTVGFDSAKVSEIFRLIVKSIEREIEAEGFVDPDVVREYRKYSDLITEAVEDFPTLFGIGITEYLRSLPPYGIAEKSIVLGDSSSRLLKKNRRTAPASRTFRSRLRGRFTQVFDRRVESSSRVVSLAAKDINAITSDSEVSSSPEIPSDVDPDLLTATFAGGGKKLFDDIVRLFNSAAGFGGYQGSVAGSLEYQSLYFEYLMAMSYGRALPLGLLGEGFGRFDIAFGQRAIRSEQAPGLKFLEVLYTTRSANQTTTASNPVAVKYIDKGLKDRYEERVNDIVGLDFASLTLEALYTRCLKVGDSAQAVFNLNPEGIGHTRLHMQLLNSVFPSSSDFVGRNTGLTGGIFTLLSAHRRLYSLLGDRNTGVYGISDAIKPLKELVESMADTLRGLGFKPGGFVPSLELTIHEPRRSEVRKRIERLGFTQVEVERIMSAGSFAEFLETLAPLTDAQDVVSFFRAFDLTKLIYEFGGQSAITQYIDFLYGRNPGESLIRLLSLLDTNRTQDLRIIGSKYSKLIGYLVTLTYAINPSELNKFNEFLTRNNLNLLESISLLVEQGSRTVIKPQGEINLLSGAVAQLVVSDNSGYEGQKPLWNKLIEQSAGNVGLGVKGLYNDREGITPTELYKLLNRPSANSPLGEMLNGVRGGRMTSILRYCNVFGLLYSLSDFRNSHQLLNRQAESYGALLSLVESLDELAQAVELSSLVLENFDTVDGGQGGLQPIVAAQNKEFGAIIDLVSGSDNERKIAESPGIGNSRRPNGVRIQNSLLPEEAALITSRAPRLGVFSQSQGEGGSFVRVAISNLLAQGIIVDGGKVDPGSALSNETDEVVPASDYQTFYETDTESSRPTPLLLTPSDAFDPVESCRRFGGTDCERDDVSSICQKGFGKALEPEQGYGTDVVGTGVPVDRPLGQSLSRRVVPTVIGRADPNYHFSVQGLTELSRSKVFKPTEKLCATLSDPFEYSACISMLKCKRFDPPYRGKYFFEFCPRSLFGGRLAQ